MAIGADKFRPRASAVLLTAMLAVAMAAPAWAESEAVPVASDMRVAGDAKHTRFIVDLDRKIDLRAFTLADPYRVVIDIPQVKFELKSPVGEAGRGLVKAYRYGLVMPGGSRIVIDLAGPAKIAKSYVLDAANGQPARMIVELDAADRVAFMRQLSVHRDAPATAATSPQVAAASQDPRPVVVIDPGHGGADFGTTAAKGEKEKEIVLAFARDLRGVLNESGKYRVVMTRDDDIFIPLAERVKIARNHGAALFISIHADALPKAEGDAQGATVYTLSETASDAEAARLADAENRADAIGGINLNEEPIDVADILIDLAQRETHAFSSQFANLLVSNLKGTARLHKKPLKSAGFRVLKAPDTPSVLVELGYVSNKGDLGLLVSDKWRHRTAMSMAKAVDRYFAHKFAAAGPMR